MLHDHHSTAAIMVTPLSGVRTVCGRPAFTGAGIVTIHDTRRRCWNHRNTLASRRRRPQNVGHRSVHQQPTVSIVAGSEGSSFCVFHVHSITTAAVKRIVLGTIYNAVHSHDT